MLLCLSVVLCYLAFLSKHLMDDLSHVHAALYVCSINVHIHAFVCVQYVRQLFNQQPHSIFPCIISLLLNDIFIRTCTLYFV